MSDIEVMQKLLEVVLTRIEDLNDKIKLTKASNPESAVELRENKKALAVQLRVKITLIKSIQELTPSTNTMTIFSPLKPVRSFFSRVRGYFTG